MAQATNWNALGNCRTGDPDRLFVTGAKQREARIICRGCPVLTQCLATALDQKIEYGVWGGMTERERRATLRSRPDVTSWGGLLSQIAARHSAKRVDAHPDSGQSVAPVLPLTPTRRAPAAGTRDAAPDNQPVADAA